jgi:ribosomal protein S18 acetylase RimI-like enzyme
VGASRGTDQLDALVGRRVALRHRLSGADGSGLLTDAVGELADDGPEAVLVHTRRGVVRVARAAVTAVREIPPPVPRRPSWAAVARLERVCSDAWPPVVVQPLGQWRLRAAGGFTGRANSALVVGDPGMAVADALDRVRAFAAEHGMPPRVQVATGSPWQREVAAHGWVLDEGRPAGADVSVLVAELAELADPSDGVGPLDSAGFAPPRIAVDDRPGEEWWELSADHPVTDAQRHVLTAPGLAHVGFGVARETAGPDPADRDTGPVVGVVRLAMVDEHLHVARLAVAPPYRRRGLGASIMRAAAGWGVTRGARWCVLQVAEHNDAAVALYQRLGFRPHHRYQYLRPAGEPT